MLPISLKLVNQILNLEANPRLDLSVCAFAEHGLQAGLQVVEAHYRRLGFVLTFWLGRGCSFDLILFAACGSGWLFWDRRRGWLWFRTGIVCLLSTLALLIDSVSSQSVQHTAKDFNVASSRLLE